MVNGVRLIIYNKESVYDDVFVTPYFVCTFDINLVKDVFPKRKINPIVLRKKGFNAYLVSIFIDTLQRSEIYRNSVVDMLTDFLETTTNADELNPVILIKLCNPKYQFIDYAWNEKLTRMLMIQQNINNGMSWLSTLGGAFSSLGDEFDNCAKIAGEISLEQFKLSMQLRDPQLAARCKLYLALSLLQQGYLKITKRMVISIYAFAIDDNDVRLQKMCQGVWAKLKYYYSVRKHTVKKLQNYKMIHAIEK